jgi:hypothetical protein
MQRSPIDLKPMSDENYAFFLSVTSKYLNHNNERGFDRIKANTCVDLDKDVKKISDEITKDPTNQLKKYFLSYAKEQVLGKFNRYDCRNKIEQTRLDKLGNLITKDAINQEQTVLGKSNLQNNIYILIGATVFITAIVILLKNKK